MILRVMPNRSWVTLGDQSRSLRHSKSIHSDSQRTSESDSNGKYTHVMVDVSEVGNTSEILKAQNVDIYIIK